MSMSAIAVELDSCRTINKSVLVSYTRYIAKDYRSSVMTSVYIRPVGNCSYEGMHNIFYPAGILAEWITCHRKAKLSTNNSCIYVTPCTGATYTAPYLTFADIHTAFKWWSAFNQSNISFDTAWILKVTFNTKYTSGFGINCILYASLGGIH